MKVSKDELFAKIPAVDEAAVDAALANERTGFDRKIIVLDATQGNHSVAQARAFNEIVRLDGIIITKLDGTPKGGALFAIARELQLPILFVGVGERMEDLAEFNSDQFVETLVDGIYA